MQVDVPAPLLGMATSAVAASRKRTGLQSDTDSDDTSVYSLSSADFSDDDFQLVRSRKAKRRNTRAYLSSSTSTAGPTRNSAVSTILFIPELATDNLRRLNRQSVSVFLEAVAPNQVTDVRVNARKNVLAIDVIHETARITLSKLTELGGMKVRSCIPLDSDTTTGVISDVDVSISSADLPILIKPAVDGCAITHVSRLGTSRCVKVVFKGESLPSHVKVGHFRHPVRPFIQRPLQCRNCLRLGHVSAVCENTRVCSRCAQPHAADSCVATVLKCPNCIGSHDATSKDCPKMRKERAVLKQMARDHSSRREAVAAIRKRRSRRRRRRRTSKNEGSSMKSAAHPTTPPPLPPRPGGVESNTDKVVPENNTEAWPALPKLQPPPQQKPQPKPQRIPQMKPQSKPQSWPQPTPQPPPQPMPQPMPQPTPQPTPQLKPQPTPQPRPQAEPQPMPQPAPQSDQSVQCTAVESRMPTPDKLPEVDRQVVVMLRSLVNTLRILLSKLHTPSARSAVQVLDTLNPVLASLE